MKLAFIALLALVLQGADMVDRFWFRTPVPAGRLVQNPVLAAELRRVLAITNDTFASASNGADTSAPVTTPIEGITLGVSPATANRAYFARLKGLRGDMDITALLVGVGRPASEISAAGAAIYEYVGAAPTDGLPTFRLRASAFVSDDGGGTGPTRVPLERPLRLAHGTEYFLAMVSATALNTGALFRAITTSGVMALGLEGVTVTTGFPSMLRLGRGDGDYGDLLPYVGYAFWGTVERAAPLSHMNADMNLVDIY